jgi:YegS/Rv2252/BmrU family lipid kinase
MAGSKDGRLVADTQRAALIVNTRSRRGGEWFQAARQALRAHGINITKEHAVRNPAQITTEVRDAIRQGFPLVVVGGGDGTLSSVVRYFVGTESVLGALPLGTGNQFARDLGIAADVETACDVIANGVAAHVDLGIAGNDYFLNVATVGLTTRIAEELTVDAKRRFGRLVYAVALLRALRRVRPFHVRLTLPHGVHEFDTLQVVVGNGRFHAGPFPLTPGATITDGLLVAYVLNATDRTAILRFALNLPGGHHVDLDSVPTFETTEAMLEATPVQRVTVDGEIVFKTPIRFGIEPRALRVMAPADFAG